MKQSRDISILLEQLDNGSDDDPDAEWKAAIALGECTSPEDKQLAVSALIGALSGGRAHALVRTHAVESLGKLRDPRAVPALAAALRDPYRLVRAYTCQPLSDLGDPHEVIDLLLQTLEADDFFGVRAEAARAVATLSAQQDDKALHQRIRKALERRREVELSNFEPGSERVIAEIDRSLELFIHQDKQ